MLVHQPALGPVDRLARFEPFGEVGVLVLERDDLLEAAERHLDRGQQVALLERLHQIREGARVARLLDEVVLRERGEDQHRGEPLARDGARRGEAVHARHLDVEDRELGLQLAHELDRLVAAAGLADDLVALFLEDLLEIETDDRLVFGDHDAHGFAHRFGPLSGSLKTEGAGSGARWPCGRAARPGRARARRSARRSVSRWRAWASAWRRISWASASASGVSETSERSRASSASAVEERALLLGDRQLGAEALQPVAHVDEPALQQGLGHGTGQSTAAAAQGCGIV